MINDPNNKLLVMRTIANSLLEAVINCNRTLANSECKGRVKYSKTDNRWCLCFKDMYYTIFIHRRHNNYSFTVYNNKYKTYTR